MQTYEKNFPKQMFRKVFKQFLFIHTIAVARVLGSIFNQETRRDFWRPNATTEKSLFNALSSLDAQSRK